MSKNHQIPEAIRLMLARALAIPPACAHCRRPVERVSLDLGDPDRATIKARCHGDESEVVVTAADLTGATNIQFTRAFAAV